MHCLLIRLLSTFFCLLMVNKLQTKPDINVCRLTWRENGREIASCEQISGAAARLAYPSRGKRQLLIFLTTLYNGVTRLCFCLQNVNFFSAVDFRRHVLSPTKLNINSMTL